MFLVYFNDLLFELLSQVCLFADDTAMYLTVGGTEDGKVLQTDLDRLSVLEKRWDMECNPLEVPVGTDDNSQGQTVNPFYSDTRYNNKIGYNDNLNVTKSSLKR